MIADSQGPAIVRPSLIDVSFCPNRKIHPNLSEPARVSSNPCLPENSGDRRVFDPLDEDRPTVGFPADAVDTDIAQRKCPRVKQRAPGPTTVSAAVAEPQHDYV
jgi:hypothetical protein